MHGFDHTSVEVIDRAEAPGATVEVLQYNKLRGSADLRTAEQLYLANQAGVRLKMVRIVLQNSQVRIEPGALYYMRGALELKASTGGGLMKALKRKFTSRESFFVSEIHGSGEIVLEPSFGHFLLHRLDPKEGGLVADKGMFYAGTAGLDVSAQLQKNVSSALFGGEGYFQTAIQGSGIAVLVSPVPREEIVRYDLRGEKLSVDGNFALMRSSTVGFAAEKSSKSLFSTIASGEGLLQTFMGHGSVWIAPTQGVYERLAQPAGISAIGQPGGTMGTQTTT